MYEAGKPFEFKTIAQGTATHVFAAFSPEIAAHNGKYCIDVRVGKDWEVRNNAASEEDAARLWKLSEEMVGQTFE